ncbi:hypothetical protein ACH5RR_005996 [Cinchona calisaya]|uniref:Elongation factor Ts, mitochondrial n=1 Tax=Cinchona calisaya TaxID=153742 RepID=A0ABD3AMQ5_9GENT
MTPVVPSSPSNSLVTSGNAFINRKDNFLTRCGILRKSRKQVLLSQRYILPMSTSLRFFPQFRIGCAFQHNLRRHIVSATQTDVAVEETDLPVADKDIDEVSETPSDAIEESEDSSAKSDAGSTPGRSKRTRPGRKSDMPPIKNEDLIPGATFTGKVRSIQPFGAFVDFGAFTDGLVHVSNLSDSYVKDVGDVVSVGQEVTVRLVEANTETGRISLTMRESDDPSKPQKQKDAPAGTSRPPRKSNQRRDEVKRSSKFVKGQELDGTVKNLVRAGAFISLPEGEEGFLPTSEEADEGFGNFMGGSSLQVGQEVKVCVLNINRGKVQLTMKKGEAAGEFDLVQGVVHAATNPFVLAFHKNKDIAAFLDEQEKDIKPTEPSEENVLDMDATVNIVDDTETTDKNEDQGSIGSDAPQGVDNSLHIAEEEPEGSPETLSPHGSTSATIDTVDEAVTLDKLDDQEDILDDSSQGVDSAVGNTEEENEASSDVLVAAGSTSDVVPITGVLPATEKVEHGEKSELSGEISEQTSSSETLIGKEGTEDEVKDVTVKDEVQIETLIEEKELISVDKNEEETVAHDLERTGGVASSGRQLDVALNPEKEGAVTEVTENQIDSSSVADAVQAKSPPSESGFSSGPTVITEEVGPDSAKNGNVADFSEQSGAPSQKDAITKAAISPALVKQLREETGAGMMDCKKALSETGGDMVKAQEFLRKKGLASADKKASRTTAEGRIGSYIHDSRIGVLIEVNCETDFVARGDIFKELVEDLAMQVAACPQVQYLVSDDVPREIVDKEREIEMQKEDLLSKPEQIRSKIVDGRIKKRLDELALLEQPYIKNDKMVVKDWVKQTIATIGENIKVKRFVRYNLGEGLEKKSQDFAAEVTAQTTAKPTEPKEEQPVAVEATETVEKPVKSTISPALVKQLREETGAGMMDCKKALSETGGDLKKAPEYLRKKGLSSAEKKSSRLAAEGRIGSYIHDSRIGALIEVNCETDFVGRSENFKELVDDLAMQVVAIPQVQYVSIEDIPASIVNKEKELEMQREDLQSKPENIREKIVEGRVSKRLGELALLEQPFIKNDGILVKDLVKQTVAALGENIKVRRFVRFTLGEESKPDSAEEAAAGVKE